MAKGFNTRGPGRPTIITDKLVEDIVKCIKMGNSVETSANMYGLHRQTLLNWLKRGNEVGEDSPKSEWVYAEFATKLKQALAEAETLDVASIDKAASNGQWQAAAWRLERRNPKNWGRKKLESDESMYDQLDYEERKDDPITKALSDLRYALLKETDNDAE